MQKKKRYGKLPICVAKTQYSLSADAAVKVRPPSVYLLYWYKIAPTDARGTLQGVPTDFTLPVREVRQFASVRAAFV